MKSLTRFKWFLWSFSRFKIPLIGYLKPKIISFNEKQVIVKLPLFRRSKNHLNSMYFGALAVGADLAGGLHSFYYSKSDKIKTSIVFKSFQAQFLSRAESDVYFVCDMGDDVKIMIEESEKTKERINKLMIINAFTSYPENPVQVATFSLELSIKVL
ncbi:DUF4442 domain-containing protein [Legionella fairfieldensis]|uniref:DUF4442 domain-containing protein n=1 Tax=Legionella fairfieldensis TaxID=45064 RepID=UPI00048D16D3|nr:DUF4442 domain-containing protein [Legionella fairfieldensis]